MRYREFVATVQDEAHVSDDEAQRAACATLRTLSERLSTGETEDIAERLPGELRSCLEPQEPFSPFHADEFVRRVAQRAGIDAGTAERDARAVFVALWRAVGPEEFDDLRSELPRDFDPLLAEALDEEAPPRPEPGAVPALSAEDFLARLEQRLGLPRARAQRAAEAVLEVLATRLTAGQVIDIEQRVPEELRPALARGRLGTGGRARRISLETFLREVASLEGVTLSEATQHARAVLRTLRESIGEEEWSDTVAQLPGGFQELWRDVTV